MKILIAIVLVALPSWALACPGLHVSDAWIREAPPGAAVMAAYAQLHNQGDTALIIDGARSTAFGAIELHRTLEQDGVSRMLRGQSLELAPGDRGAFAPGGYHLMLFRPQQPLQAGDLVDIEILCGTEPTSVRFDVRKAP